MKKRVPVLILASALLFPCINVTHSYADGGDYSRDIEIVSSLGYFDALEDKGEYETVTRAEFTQSVVDLMGIEVTEQNYKWFSDVDEDDECYPYVSAAAQYGIVHGTDGKFYPDDEITYLEAATILVNALGYKDYAMLEGAYSVGYLKIAADVGIKKQITASEKTQISAGMAARMILNTGHANMVNIKIAGDRIEQTKGNTLFWEKQNISSGKGILEANEYTLLDSPTGIGKNNVRIDGFEGKLYNSDASVQYLGCYVEYYYKEDDGEYTIYYIEPAENKNEMTVVEAEDINEFDEENNRLSYNIGEKSKNINILPGTYMIYNGKQTLNYYYEENGERRFIFDLENGDIKLIDNDGDGDVEVVNITSYENYVVSGVDTKNEIIYDMYDSEKVLDFEEDEENTWLITDIEGNIVRIEEISQMDVLSVAKSPDKHFLRAVLSRQKESGNITTKKFDDDDVILTLDGAEYKVSRSYLDFNEALTGTELERLPAVGTKVTVFLDYKGKIAAIEAGEGASGGYAFVIKKIYDDVEEKYILKLLTEDGKKADYKLAKSVTIDGEKYRDSGLLQYMADDFSEYQVVTYKTNIRSEVTVLDTIKKGNGGENDKLRSFQDSHIDLSYIPHRRSFESEMMFVDYETILFKTPDKDINPYEYSEYCIPEIPQNGPVMSVRGYTTDPDGFLPQCIHWISSTESLRDSSPYMLVEYVEETIDADDEPTLRISGYSESGEVSYIVSSYYSYDPEDSYAIDVNDVKPGDVIKYSLAADNGLGYISPLYIMDTEGLGAFYDKFPSYATNGTYFAYMGYIAARENEYLAYVANKSELLNKELVPDKVYRLVDTTQIYVVSKNGSKLSVEKADSGNYGVIKDYKHNHLKVQSLMVAAGMEPKFVVVYE